MERAMMAYRAGDEIAGAGPGSSLRYIGHSRSQGSELAVQVEDREDGGKDARYVRTRAAGRCQGWQGYG
jgi:hypothetical protein